MNKETNPLNHNRLSIQLSSDGFSFCVYNTIEKSYKNLVEIKFNTSFTNPNILLQEVKQVFKNNDLLHDKYEEILLIHHHNLNTFVPQSYFDKDLLHQYLENSVKTFENDFVSYDEINTLKINNIYIPFVNINNFIFDSFGEFTYLHSSTVFLENVLKNYNVSDKEMFVNVYQNNFQLLVLENNQLILSNCFNYQTKEDFVYYILFVAEQLKMNTNEFTLNLFGNIKETNESYKLLYNYIRNVVIYSKINPHLSSNITNLPQEHFNLLQLHI